MADRRVEGAAVIQSDVKLTLSMDGTVGIIETSVVTDDECTPDQASWAITVSDQILNRSIASALAISERVPESAESLTPPSE